MAMILIYVGLRIARPDVSWILPYVKGEAAAPILQAAQQNNITVEQLLIEGMTTLYAMVGAITVLYQGGMTVYYLRRRVAVEIALQEHEAQ